jgi:hypothetical protein
MDTQDPTARARNIYTAYGRATAHKTPTGGKLPKWDDLDDKHQRAWTKTCDHAGAEALIALADRIDGGAPSGPVTLLMREEAAKLLSADSGTDPEVLPAAVGGVVPAGVDGATPAAPRTAQEDAALTEKKASGQ